MDRSRVEVIFEEILEEHPGLAEKIATMYDDLGAYELREQLNTISWFKKNKGGELYLHLYFFYLFSILIYRQLVYNINVNKLQGEWSIWHKN